MDNNSPSSLQEPTGRTRAEAMRAGQETAPAPEKRVRTSEVRIHDEPAFVLHSYPYKETSLIVEVLTRHHGRVALIARGAKRPRSAMRGVLQGFQPLALAWTSGRSRTSELRTLTKAEWVGGLAPLRGAGLLCGFYLNELLIKLLAREDAHEALFDSYIHAVAQLSQGGPAEPSLRAFEYALLREAGYAIRLSHCVESGAPIRAEGRYRYRPEHGPFGVADGFSGAGRDDQIIFGKTLLDIGAGDFSDATTLSQSKQLMRYLLNYHLAGQNLNTRQMMIDLQNL